ncbi:MAG: hypothetical protein AB7O39_03210 [Flavobacteriaceae bacterium]
MNLNTASAVFLLIIAGAGIATGNPATYLLAAISAGLAVVVEEMRNQWEAFPAFHAMPGIIAILAAASWGVAVMSFLSLI